MYSLHNNPILYPHQIKLLSLFFTSPFGKPFFFTGGTALSAFYLTHRESQDLDFFSSHSFDTLVLRMTMQEIADKTQSAMTMHIRSQTYNEIFLENERGGWRQKIDIVQEQPKHFGEIVHIDNIPVDSLVNIATNKILAVFGRLEPKDYIDLFVICTKTDLIFDEMFTLAKQKDTGLSEFYFANTIAVLLLIVIPILAVKISLGILSLIAFGAVLYGFIYYIFSEIWATRIVVVEKKSGRESLFRGYKIAKKKTWAMILLGLVNTILSFFIMAIPILFVIGVFFGGILTADKNEALGVGLFVIGIILIIPIIIAMTLVGGIVNAFKAAIWSIAYNNIRGKYDAK